MNTRGLIRVSNGTDSKKVIFFYFSEIVTTISVLETVETTLTTTLTPSVLADFSPPDSALSVIRNN